MLQGAEGFECYIAKFEAFFEFQAAQVGAAGYEMCHGFVVEGVVKPGEFEGFKVVAGTGKEFSPFGIGDKVGGFELEVA